MAGNTSAPGTTVTSRALSLLGAFDQRHRILSLTELAGARGLPDADGPPPGGRARRVGSVDPPGRRSLRHREPTVGRRAAGTGPDRAAAGRVPFLHDVYAATLATVHLAVRDRHQVLYLERLSGRASVPIVSTVGSRLPLHCTGVGKVLLAFAPESVQREVLRSRLRRVTRHTVTAPGLLADQLRRVRAEGYATTVEEMSLGACSVAVPIRQGADVVASVGIVVPSLRRDRPRLGRLCRSPPAASSGAWAGPPDASSWPLVPSPARATRPGRGRWTADRQLGRGDDLRGRLGVLALVLDEGREQVDGGAAGLVGSVAERRARRARTSRSRRCCRSPRR